MATISRSASRRRRRSRYNIFPGWMTRKRVIVSVTLVFSLAFASAVVYGVRLSFALAKTFHTSRDAACSASTSCSTATAATGIPAVI
jgi:hypothetical protein